MSGVFITFEGPDGAGKTTQLQRLSRHLQQLGTEHICTREPGGTPTAERIRTLIFDPEVQLVPDAELLLFAAARAQHVQECIAPALEQGRWVLCDRFTLSTLVYQGYGRGLSHERIYQLSAMATGGLQPHLQLVVDVDALHGQQRIHQRHGDVNNRFDTLSCEFHQRVVEGFRAAASSEANCFVVDGRNSEDEVHHSIINALQQRGLL
ncbi:dTMP kinase [Desulfurispira natronophila]|uniref:Thymidylate kinase n=1 Tax=Desulfurispira natronophila TaxID=682562 RepID=A0A7W7Y4Y2_9BACT|nr:dTMP kinase [Desulfurispira natronophila]MBB5022178.1 dTMP kinase [Desulfurispira natronophila]